MIRRVSRLGRGGVEHSGPPTHGEAVVCKGRPALVLLVELLLTADGMLHKVHRLQDWGGYNPRETMKRATKRGILCFFLAHTHTHTQILASGGTIM